MEKRKKLFIVWGILVIGIVALLVVMSILVRGKLDKYTNLEKKLVEAATKYFDVNFLYPENSDVVKVTSQELIDGEYIEPLTANGEACVGYVTLKLDGVYQYKAYIKCGEYTTKGY